MCDTDEKPGTPASPPIRATLHATVLPTDILAGKKFLVVDDELFCREMIRRYLSLEGVLASNIVTAASAQEALHFLTDPNYHCHVVISDVRIPGVSGLQLLETVRDWRLASDVVWIVVSGTFTAAEQEHVQNLDAIPLDKPFEIDQLLQIVRVRLELKAVSRTPD